ncbi:MULTISPECIES: hypothetical protein [unclassified Microcoleus]|uniref:hypothetical protein n=1 Tax=unclassified Microcoleus TaxID=2642155 RepID=UPI002FCFACD6
MNEIFYRRGRRGASGEEWQIYRPDGEPFTSYEEVSRSLEQDQQRAEQERLRAEQAEQRAALLAERLRAMGIDPEQL